MAHSHINRFPPHVILWGGTGQAKVVRPIIEPMARLGYDLVFKGGQERKYDRSNFPQSHRFEQMCSLLFVQSPSL